MSLISWLNQHPVFIEEVTFQVEDAMKGREIAQLPQEGSGQGIITQFRLLMPITLQFAECVGCTCAIPFEASGIATGESATDSATKTAFTRRGKVFGVVDVRFPSDSWSPDAYLRMYPHIERLVVVESVEFEGG